MLFSLREVQFGLSLVVLDSLVIGVIILNRVICAFNPTLQARMSVGANPKRILELIFSKFHFSQAEPKFYFKTVLNSGQCGQMALTTLPKRQNVR